MENQHLFERRVFNFYCRENNITKEQLEQKCSSCSYRFACSSKEFRWYMAFDKVLSWHCTREGYKFWYFHQMNFVKLLILAAKKCDMKISKYTDYLGKLLAGYGSHDYDNTKEYKEIQKFYEEC